MADTPPIPAGAAKKAAGAAKKAAPAKASSGRGPGRPSNDEKLAQALGQTYAALGHGVGKALPLFGVDPRRANAVGLIIAANSNEAAESWVQLAKTNANVRTYLEKMTEAGGWGSVVFAHVGIGMAIAMVMKADTPEAAELVGQIMANPAMAEAMAANMGAGGPGA